VDNLALAIDASICAGKKILEVYKTTFSVEMKEDRTPLTLADKESHNIIASMLSETGLPLLSEEGKNISYKERKNWENFWLVDPLDGTKEFVKRNGEFTVNIALVEQQLPVMGIIYVPVNKTLYFASKDIGSYVNHSIEDTITSLDDLIQSSEPINAARDAGIYTVVASRSHFSTDTKKFVEGLRQEHPNLQFITAGSSLKLCLVAEGKANIYPRLAPTMEWDTAAGHAIVECAGGRVLQYESRQPLVYNKESLLNPWFVVS
jgi:3'(2'), 5'-bisphosphate nucleotidase